MSPKSSSPAAPPKKREPRAVSRWGQDRRLEFIDFRLQWDGRLNRSDLVSFFGISVPQASLDIARYAEIAPRNLEYDRSARLYVAGQSFSAVYPGSNASRYLNELLAREAGVLPPEASFLGWTPPIAAMPVPGRALEPQTVSGLLRAVREGTGVRVTYQSMSRPEPVERELTPHAFGHDGFRWHVRAYCHMRDEFRDFVIARMTNMVACASAGPGADRDEKWNKVLTLTLVPNPKLSPAHRQAIATDFGMVNGEVRLECRQALAFYVLRHLGLLVDMPDQPETQQVVLKNRSEVLPHLNLRQLAA